MQRTTINATGGLFLLGLLVLFGVMVWGCSPQAAVTMQSPLPTAPADPIADAPCLTASDARFVFDFDGYVTGDDGTTTLTYTVTNANKKDISYLAFGTANWTRLAPRDGITTTLGLGEYQVEWTKDKGNPGFTSIKYETHFGGYSQGAAETFTMTVSGFDPSQPIALEAKAGQDKGRVTIMLADPACDKTPPPPPPFSPLPTPTPTPEAGVVLPTEPQVAECVFEPPAGGPPPEEPIIPLSAYSFSEPQVVLTNTAPMGIEQWLPDNETLMVSRESGISQTVSVDLVNTVTGNILQVVEPRAYLSNPRWLAADQTVFWSEAGPFQDPQFNFNQPGYWLRSLTSSVTKRLSANGNAGWSMTYDIATDGKRVVFLSLPGGTQPLIWDQETKELRFLPVDLNDWRYRNGPIYRPRPFNVNWQPSGDKILFWDGSWAFLYDLASNSGCEIKMNVLSPLSPAVQEASWSPNGRYLLLQVAIDPPMTTLKGPYGEVLILDTYTGKAVQISLGTVASNFSWAPDNQTAVFKGDTGKTINIPNIGAIDGAGLYLFNIHNGQHQQILPEYFIGGFGGIHWSPDGSRLVFQGSPLAGDEFAATGGGFVTQVTLNQ
ncbi:MAG: hypothetical protein R3A44_33710 [Caldilineaceae bacterium]